MRPEARTSPLPTCPAESSGSARRRTRCRWLTAGGPVLIHFVDFAQLNSVRTLPYLSEWDRRYQGARAFAPSSCRRRASPSAVIARVVAAGFARPRRRAAHRDGRDGDPLELWHAYGCEGWPSLFLWKTGGALAWFYFGEGEYRATEGGDPGRAARARRPARPARPDGPPAPHRRAGRQGDAPHPRALPRRLLGAPLDRRRGRRQPGRSPTKPAAPTPRSRASGDLDGRPRRRQSPTRSPSTAPALYTLGRAPPPRAPPRSRSDPSPGLRIWSISFAAGMPS